MRWFVVLIALAASACAPAGFVSNSVSSHPTPGYCQSIGQWYDVAAQKCTVPSQPVAQIPYTPPPPAITESIEQKGASHGTSAVSDNQIKLQSYAECAGVFELAGITQKLAERDAPPYARDKYRQRYEFYLQGSVNIERYAAKIDGYDKEKFAELTHAAYRTESDSLNESYLPIFNKKIEVCVGMALLNLSDFPQ